MDKKQELAKEAKKNISELAELLDVTNDTLAEIKQPSLKAQTAANKRWEEKTGVQSKSYKLDAETVKKFAEACQISGKTQSEVLSAFMTAYAFIFCPANPVERTE